MDEKLQFKWFFVLLFRPQLQSHFYSCAVGVGTEKSHRVKGIYECALFCKYSLKLVTLSKNGCYVKMFSLSSLSKRSRFVGGVQ